MLSGHVRPNWPHMQILRRTQDRATSKKGKRVVRPMDVTDGRAGQMTGLTGLRAIAAVWVVSFHYSVGPFSSLHAQRAVPLIGFGYFGVDLFFMLSGFVIWHVHSEDFRRPTMPAFRRFVLLRMARLYPVYVATLLILAAIFILAPRMGEPHFDPKNYTAHEFGVDVLMMQTWGLSKHLNWNYPAWSVSAEWFCYFLFPLAVVPLAMLKRAPTTVGIIFLVAALAAIYLFVFRRTFNQTLGWMALTRALMEFLLGCLLRRISDEPALARIAWTPIFLTFVTAAYAAIWLRAPLAGFAPILVFPVLILAACRADNLVGQVASWRPLVVMGEASYSLYLAQAPVQKAVRFLSSDVSLHAPLVASAIVLAYAGALALATTTIYKLIELPSRRRLRRLVQAYA